MSALDFKSIFEAAVLPRFTYLEDLVVSAYHFFEQMRCACPSARSSPQSPRLARPRSRRSPLSVVARCWPVSRRQCP